MEEVHVEKEDLDAVRDDVDLGAEDGLLAGLPGQGAVEDVPQPMDAEADEIRRRIAADRRQDEEDERAAEPEEGHDIGRAEGAPGIAGPEKPSGHRSHPSRPGLLETASCVASNI